MARTYTYANVAGLRRALRALPKEAQATMRDASSDIAADVAGRAAVRARFVGGVAKHVAPTIKARRDRVPKVVMGGSTRLPDRPGGRSGRGQTVGDVIWGAEFGGGRRPSTRQFSPWRGNGEGAGYFLWPTVRENADETMERYGDALVKAVDRAAR